MTPVTALATRSLGPLALFGGAALWLGVWLWPTAGGAAMYRLVLHAPEQDGACYVSAWSDGDVFASIDPRHAQRLEFRRHGLQHDGCSWTGVETLEPLTPGAYHYLYREIIDSCDPDAVPYDKTPRVGLVTLERVEGTVAATDREADQAPMDLPSTVGDDDDDDCDCQVSDEDEGDDDGDQIQVSVHDVELID
jgi:hypothetical protein